MPRPDSTRWQVDTTAPTRPQTNSDQVQVDVPWRHVNLNCSIEPIGVSQPSNFAFC